MVLQPKRILVHRVCVLDVMHDPETDHIKLNIDTPTPITTHAQRRELVRILRKAVDKLEDHTAWSHITEVVATAQGKKPS